jgi:hypothetical protein
METALTETPTGGGGADVSSPIMRASSSSRLGRLVRRNSLGVVLVATFLVVWLAGQSTAGLHVYNQERVDAGLSAVSWWRYLTT